MLILQVDRTAVYLMIYKGNFLFILKSWQSVSPPRVYPYDNDIIERAV